MRKAKKVGVGVFAFFAVAAVAVAMAMFGIFSATLDKAFPATAEANDTTAEAYQNALAVAQEVEAEGVVLLKNDNNTLPLASTKVNLLGYGAYNPVYGGSGSGGSSYGVDRTDFVTAFESEGIEVNPNVKSVYEVPETSSDQVSFAADFSLNEVPATQELADQQGVDFKYTGDASFEAMREYSDTAVVVFSRAGGEDCDLPTSMEEYATNDSDKAKHYLELNDAEKSLLAQAKANFDHVIVMINSGNALELGFVKDVDAALWIGDPGDVGTKAVAQILKGDVNPSGRTADIYPYAVETSPSYYNFDTYEYTNSNACFADFDSHPAYLLNYQEGIYVGYRYYETRDSFDYTTLEGEQVTGASYDDVVQYPFGYGLSYTSFEWKVSSATNEGAVDNNSTIKVSVDVTNTGSVAGKDVVELYYKAPYYANGSHIQKSNVVFAGYAKTKLLDPGETQTVTIELSVEDMASYDDLCYYSNNGSYVLEKGDYEISVRRNSHDVVDTLTYNIANSIVFNESDTATGIEAAAKYVGKRSSDKVVATNQFDDARGDVAYMDRDTWTIVPGSSIEATDEQLQIFSSALDINLEENADDVMPTTGAKNGVVLSDLRGKSYDDPQWSDLLDELTLDDYQNMLAVNGWGCAAADSIGKPQTYDMDGPAAINYVLDRWMGTCTYKTVSYPCEVVLASSFNTDVAAKFGDAVSREADAWNVSGWYAPGCNLHRSAFGGRNFEYYSEDPVLSGTMVASVVGKATENGLICYVKHFVMNERETQRHYGLCTWATEQSMRELYMVPFEDVVKDGKTLGLMSSYNNLGTTWAGGSTALLKNVMRGEWGFEGCLLTDNLEQHGFMDTEVAILNGGSSTLSNGMMSQDDVSTLVKSATGMKYLREAAHQYLYAEANSIACELTPGEPVWRMPARVGCIVAGVVGVAGVAALFITEKRKG